MMYKLADSASRKWKRLKEYEKLKFVVEGTFSKTEKFNRTPPNSISQNTF